MSIAHATRELATSLGVALSSDAEKQLVAFASLVETWNARIDLTAAKGPTQLAEVLFADAMMLADGAAIASGARFVDIGSGAGAPALPLLILRPDLRAILVEPLQKRVAFMRTAVGSLPGLLGRVDVVGGKINADDPTVAGAPFDVAMSRATFAPDVWVRAGARLAPRVIVLTSRDEIHTLPAELQAEHVVEYTLPRTSARRVLTVYMKASTAG